MGEINEFAPVRREEFRFGNKTDIPIILYDRKVPGAAVLEFLHYLLHAVGSVKDLLRRVLHKGRHPEFFVDLYVEHIFPDIVQKHDTFQPVFRIQYGKDIAF